MGHLLSTVNSEAADAIRPLVALGALPEVGEVVRYHMRQGHGRAGRTFFPALVQGHGERHTLHLTVIIDAQDFADETQVSQIGPGAEFHCWERISSAAPSGLHGTVAALHERIGDLEEENRKMRDIILGDYDVPKVALFEIFAKLEGRLKALEAAPDDALDPVRRAPKKAAKKAAKKNGRK